MREMWTTIVGYAGHYEVSTRGRIRSLPRRVRTRGGATRLVAGVLVRPQLMTSPRCRLVVTLWRENKRKVLGVGRLVLEAFVGPAPAGYQCCHFPDRDPANCCLPNLRWDTPQANCHDKIAHGTYHRGEKHGGARLTDALVRQIRRRRAEGHLPHDIAADIGVGASTVWDVVKGRTWQHVA